MSDIIHAEIELRSRSSYALTHTGPMKAKPTIPSQHAEFELARGLYALYTRPFA